MHLLAGATGWNSNSCCPWPSCRDARRPPHLREGNIEALKNYNRVSQGSFKGVYRGSIVGFCDIGALIIRIGFGV